MTPVVPGPHGRRSGSPARKGGVVHVTETEGLGDPDQVRSEEHACSEQPGRDILELNASRNSRDRRSIVSGFVEGQSWPRACICSFQPAPLVSLPS